MSERPAKKHEIVTLEIIRELVADLPGIEEGLSYGTKAFKVRKSLIARIHQTKAGASRTFGQSLATEGSGETNRGVRVVFMTQHQGTKNHEGSQR